MYGLTQVSASASEPLTVPELRSWVRQDQTFDDATIEALGKAARALVEGLSGRQLVTATWRLDIDGFPWPGGWQYLDAPLLFPNPHTIRLPKAPLQSVTSVQYYDLSDTLQTLDPSVYDVDVARDPGRISLAMNRVWPVTRLRPGAVRITFVAGYGAASAVPEEIKQAIRVTVAQWYEHRGEEGELPLAAKSLLNLIWNGEWEYGE